MPDLTRQAVAPTSNLAADDLAIFEDDRDNPLPFGGASFFRSPFRLAEYGAYVRHFPHSALYSSYVQARGPADEHVGAFAKAHPDLGARLRPFDPSRPVRCRLAYTVFLNNVLAFLNYFERHNLPFCFTLYPGGGMRIDDPPTDRRLRRVFTSPCFRKVIVTQDLTDRYLRRRRLCPPDRIEFLYGGLYPLEELARACPPKKLYPRDKPHFDVCFVAFKYSARGEDKGFDVFLDCAARLMSRAPETRFHVVGNFTEADVPADLPRDRFFFYGPQPAEFFPAFYSEIDLILAPTRPSVICPGAFDGFPTGCCMEAGACGVAVLCTDPLGMNVALKDGEDLILIPHDAEWVAATVLDLYRNPDALYRLAERGRQTFRRVFGAGAQLEPRLRLLERCLKPSAADRWRGLAETGVRRLLRRPAPGSGQELALTPREFASVRLLPADGGGLPAELLTVCEEGRFDLQAPPPHLDVATTVGLNLECERPLRSLRFTATTAPRTADGPLPLQLTLSAQGGPGGQGEPLAESTETLDPETSSRALALDLATPRVVRSLRLRLRMAPGAAHNWFGRVTVSDIHLVPV
jgi:glycosyltransferase involved in cell wall biosynthesis